MKIRHPALIRIIAWFLTMTAKLLLATMRHRVRPLGQWVLPDNPEIPGPFIYSFWHEVLVVIARYARPDARVLISHHADGQLIADVARFLGTEAIRGSSTRGGTSALWEMIQAAKDNHLVVTPDGPRGPRRVIRPGLIYLAAKTGLPIVPVGIAYSREWRFPSWDRFAMPKPFSTSYIVSGELVYVPKNIEPDELEPYLNRLQSEMDRAMRVAEHWAQTGRFDPDVALPTPDLAPRLAS